MSWYQKYFVDNRDFEALDRAKIFSWQQILLCTSLVLIAAIAVIIFSKRSQKAQEIALYVGASIILLLEVLRWIWLGTMRYHAFIKFIFHFNLCNILAVFVPISVLFIKKRTCYAASFIYGILGGLVVMIYPRDVIDGMYLGHIIVIQSLITHTLFLFVSAMLVVSNTYTIDVKKDWWRCGIVLTAFTILAKIMVIIYNYEENFLFMDELDFMGLNSVPFALYYPIGLLLAWGLTYLLLLLFSLIINRKSMKRKTNSF